MTAEKTSATRTALFINGIYDGVCTEILAAQASRPGLMSFLQPYRGTVIKMLREQQPSLEHPLKLYLSTTVNLSQICYTAQILRWEDKRNLPERRRQEVAEHLERHQPGEVGLFQGVDEIGLKAVNLVTIRELKGLETLHSTSLLRKTSDGLPLRKRTRAGNWSEVFELDDSIDLPPVTEDRYNSEFAAQVEASWRLSDEALKKRLASAAKLPQKLQIISVGYRRNPDVIVAVLRRAKGVCERCQAEAPFLRRSDGSPYLEVHHSTSLSQGGEDAVENAAALCPNCHREVHHGPERGEAEIQAEMTTAGWPRFGPGSSR